MRIGARTILLLAILLAAVPSVSGQARRTDSVQLSGRTYVRLNDWARLNKFAVHWLERNRTLEVTSRWTRMVFEVDPRRNTRKTTINGINVWLSFPMKLQNGAAYITQLDLDKTIRPVLYPKPNRAGTKVKTIYLDPGHGGRDPGFIVGGHEEQKYTLLLAQEVRAQLLREGFNVFLTRTADSTVELGARPEMARRGKADLFVSLHFNATEEARTVVKGVEIYCCTPAGATSFNAGGEGNTRWVAGNRSDDRNMLLAYQVQKALVKNLQVEDRGVKRARFQVLREATIPAILVEAGFMSHPTEGRKIFDPAYRRQMAGAIVDGIVAYQKAVKG